jgi:hypothetical protein
MPTGERGCHKPKPRRTYYLRRFVPLTSPRLYLEKEEIGKSAQVYKEYEVIHGEVHHKRVEQDAHKEDIEDQP